MPNLDNIFSIVIIFIAFIIIFIVTDAKSKERYPFVGRAGLEHDRQLG